MKVDKKLMRRAREEAKELDGKGGIEGFREYKVHIEELLKNNYYDSDNEFRDYVRFYLTDREIDRKKAQDLSKELCTIVIISSGGSLPLFFGALALNENGYQIAAGSLGCISFLSMGAGLLGGAVGGFLDIASRIPNPRREIRGMVPYSSLVEGARENILNNSREEAQNENR